MNLHAVHVRLSAGGHRIKILDRDMLTPAQNRRRGKPHMLPAVVFVLDLPKGSTKTDRRVAKENALMLYELRMGVVSTHKDKPDVKPKRPRLPNVDTRQSGQDSGRAASAKQVAACGVGADPP